MEATRCARRCFSYQPDVFVNFQICGVEHFTTLFFITVGKQSQCKVMEYNFSSVEKVLNLGL